MSAGICGKRLGWEDFFGSPSPPPSAKRSRCSSYGSPVRSSSPDFVTPADDKLSVLLRRFPSMDREVIETVLRNHDGKIEDAIESLHALCLGDDYARVEAAHIYSTKQSTQTQGIADSEPSELKIEGAQNGGVSTSSTVGDNRPSWVDIFVQEMMNASDWNDVRGRAMKILEAFEKSVISRTTASAENEINVLREHLQSLLRENQILKKAVSIQHERNMDHEEKLKEVQHLKVVISQYQEQIRTLELNNYALKIHLQKAENANSLPGHFHPDIF